MPDIRSLIETLQRLQQQLADLRGRLRRGPMVIQAHAKTVNRLNENLEKRKAEHQRLLLAAKEKDRQMNAAETAIAKRKTQLAEAKTNKEFQALKKQIEADEVANSVLADETLEAMEKADKGSPKVTEAETELRKGIVLAEDAKKLFAQEEPVIRADIERLAAELKTFEKQLPSDFREVYDRLIGHNGGEEAIAVVVKNKYCGGCNQQVPINSLAQILQMKPITCSCCGRLLFVPEDFVFEKK
ncbi:MAG TPA: hypothetical protein DEB39_10410 [Planctomycetaceae bacterium]|nr:hypothetical protein [Planctomycetaceae bacterium]